MELTRSATPKYISDRFESLLSKAYAPMSGFRVGCFLEDAGGNFFEGCNIENPAMVLCLCAERVAIAQWKVAGGSPIRKIYVIHESKEPLFPCGLCRQVISEFALDSSFLAWYPNEKAFFEIPFKSLFPFPFLEKSFEK